MQTLPAPANVAGILAFDFDGTIHGGKQKPPITPQFLQQIEILRKKKNYLWGICTGRSLMHLVEGMSQGLTFLPDFVVAREREIHFPGRFHRFEPDFKWNKKCEKAHQKLFKKFRKEMREIQNYVEEVVEGQWIEAPGEPAGVILKHKDAMDDLLEEITRIAGHQPKLNYERNGVYLRFSHSDYSKGSALLEIAERWSITPTSIITGGDNFNDFSMLCRQVSENPVCPENAVPEVKNLVKEQGGVIGVGHASLGITDALKKVFPDELS